MRDALGWVMAVGPQKQLFFAIWWAQWRWSTLLTKDSGVSYLLHGSDTFGQHFANQTSWTSVRFNHPLPVSWALQRLQWVGEQSAGDITFDALLSSRRSGDRCPGLSVYLKGSVLLAGLGVSWGSHGSPGRGGADWGVVAAKGRTFSPCWLVLRTSPRWAVSGLRSKSLTFLSERSTHQR